MDSVSAPAEQNRDRRDVRSDGRCSRSRMNLGALEPSSRDRGLTMVVRTSSTVAKESVHNGCRLGSPGKYSSRRWRAEPYSTVEILPRGRYTIARSLSEATLFVARPCSRK